MADALLQTTVVGSYPQPDWLVDRKMLSKGVPRTRLRELWRVPEAFLEQAQDDATLIAIRDIARAGIDVTADRTSISPAIRVNARATGSLPDSPPTLVRSRRLIRCRPC